MNLLHNEKVCVCNQALFFAIQTLYLEFDNKENKKAQLKGIAEWVFIESQKFKDDKK